MSSSNAPRILCTGIIVLDEVFRVEQFPQPDGKVQATGFFVVNGGCAANAAVAIARPRGRASLARPMGGPAGGGPHRDRVLAAFPRGGNDWPVRPRGGRLGAAAAAVF